MSMTTGDTVMVENIETEYDVEVMFSCAGMARDPRWIAEEAARAEHDDACGEMSDPKDWPQTYRVKMPMADVDVSVWLDYNPQFSGVIEKGGTE